MAKPPLGSGGRFRQGVNHIMQSEGLSKKSAGAIMANAGRKKYGASKMAKMSAAGRKKTSKKFMGF